MSILENRKECIDLMNHIFYLGNKNKIRIETQISFLTFLTNKIDLFPEKSS